ncbi:hypothetical protein Tco_1568312 [Tanacetum coccineum]
MVTLRTDAELAAPSASRDAMPPRFASRRSSTYGLLMRPFKTTWYVYKYEGDASAWWKDLISRPKEGMRGSYFDLGSFQKTVLSSDFPIEPSKECLRESNHSIHQRASENITEYKQRYLRLLVFLDRLLALQKSKAKTFVGVFIRSILDHVKLEYSFTDVAQVFVRSARNLEILHDRDAY